MARGTASEAVTVGSQGLQDIPTDAPPEFGGPEGYWSPETLLVASIADCYILSFRAVARASKLPWLSLSVDVEGVLDRPEGVTRFTRFTIAPRLAIAAGTSETLAGTVLEKAKRACLITNSLSAECALASSIETLPGDPA